MRDIYIYIFVVVYSSVSSCSKKKVVYPYFVVYSSVMQCQRFFFFLLYIQYIVYITSFPKYFIPNNSCIWSNFQVKNVNYSDILG